MTSERETKSRQPIRREHGAGIDSSPTRSGNRTPIPAPPACNGLRNDR